MPEIHEEVINVKLAEILSRELDIDCRAERVKYRRRPDIRCFYKGLTISIEASYNMGDAEKDAEKRIEQNLADIAIALYLKEHYRDVPEMELIEKIRKSKFDVKVIVGREVTDTLIRFIEKELKRVAEPTTGWFTDIDIPVLGSIIENAIEFLAKEEEMKKLIEEIKNKINRFIETLRTIDSAGSIYTQIYNILYKLYGLHIAEAEDPEVVFGQAALSILLSATFYEYTRSWHSNLSPLNSYVNQYGAIAGLRNALNELLKIDYRTAIETTLKILDILPLNPGLAGRVKDLIDLAIKVAQSPGFLRRDFAGRIYHEITGDIVLRKGFATFYTEVPAAYLLASLAVETLFDLDTRDIHSLSEDEARNIINKMKEIKIADFACGSGTLLTASYSALHRLAKLLKFYYDVDIDLNELSKIIVEEGIYGIDALRYASQITALNLALISPGNISRENIYTIYLGYIPERRQPWLGSLELFNNGGRVGGLLTWIEGGLKRVAERVSLEGAEGIFEIPEKFDLIIMNPPFTRATGRTEKFGEGRGFFGFIAEQTFRKELLKAYNNIRDNVRKELQKIAKENRNVFPNVIRDIIDGKEGLDSYLSIGQAGEGLLFLHLAYRYIKNGGIISFVLPRGLLAGISWFLARVLLATKFHVKYIIVSSDSKKGYNFSEGTSLSETLIIAKRTDKIDVNAETIFINLLSKPSTALEAIMLAEEIKNLSCNLKTNEIRLIELGSSSALILKVSRQQLLENVDNWNRFVAVPDERLIDVVINNILKEGKIMLR